MIDLLPRVLGKVLVPNSVVSECLADLENSGALAIREALRARLLIKSPDPSPAQTPFPELDAGESAAIRLALKLSVSVLIDEMAGRSIATKLGLAGIGTGAVLLAAKKRRLIPSVKPILITSRTSRTATRRARSLDSAPTEVRLNRNGHAWFGRCRQYTARLRRHRDHSSLSSSGYLGTVVPALRSELVSVNMAGGRIHRYIRCD